MKTTLKNTAGLRKGTVRRASVCVSGAPEGFEPKSELGRKLVALRARFVAKGGKMLSRSQLQNEIASRRGLK